MATNKSGSRDRAARTLARKVALSQPSAVVQSSSLAAVQVLKDLIEEERTRLMTAESVLECAMLAMDETDHDQAQGPYYQNVIGVARDLILQSIDRLDSVRLGPMLDRLALRSGSSVREYVAAYLH
jgi:hypothetical protein